MSGFDILSSKIPDLPELPGSYRMIDKDGNILYIGKAKNIKSRVSSYLKKDLSTRLSRMVFLTTELEYIITKTEAEAFLLEASLIKKHKPKYNIVLKDDKSFPYIKIRYDHEFPQILKFRGKKLDEGKYFGPFASAYDVDQTLQILQKIFKLRSCTDNYFKSRLRPCLQYQIKRCSAPCTNKISKEDYQLLIKQTENFLKGKSSELQKELADIMDDYSEKMEYEKAAEIRDRIKSLTYTQLKSGLSNIGVSNADVIAILSENDITTVQVFMYRGSQPTGGKSYFPKHTEEASQNDIILGFIGQFYQTRPCPSEIIININITDEDRDILSNALFTLYLIKPKIIYPKKGPKRKLIEHALENAKESLTQNLKKLSKNISNLEALKDIFNLDKIPERIEVYDNSHIMGKFAVGAMIVSGKDGFLKNEYRKFTIQHLSDGDDYKMLKEVLTRRLNNIINKKTTKPDLMIIDGGSGHFKIAQEVIDSFGIYIKIICMAKGKDRNSGNERFFISRNDFINLDKKSDVMKYLQILRDEVHNFAIKTHRKKRSKSIRISSLDSIENIGLIRKNSLLKFFGSFDRICQASVEELSKINGISSKLAEKLYLQLKNLN